MRACATSEWTALMRKRTDQPKPRRLSVVVPPTDATPDQLAKALLRPVPKPTDPAPQPR